MYFFQKLSFTHFVIKCYLSHLILVSRKPPEVKIYLHAKGTETKNCCQKTLTNYVARKGLDENGFCMFLYSFDISPTAPNLEKAFEDPSWSQFTYFFL